MIFNNCSTEIIREVLAIVMIAVFSTFDDILKLHLVLGFSSALCCSCAK